jgi:hypothetical protein
LWFDFKADAAFSVFGLCFHFYLDSAPAQGGFMVGCSHGAGVEIDFERL